MLLVLLAVSFLIVLAVPVLVEVGLLRPSGLIFEPFLIWLLFIAITKYYEA